jgi:hypothetical protein
MVVVAVAVAYVHFFSLSKEKALEDKALELVMDVDV